MLESQVTLYLVHENNKEVQEVYCHYSQDMLFLEVSLAQLSIAVVYPLVVISVYVAHSSRAVGIISHLPMMFWLK